MSQFIFFNMGTPLPFNGNQNLELDGNKIPALEYYKELVKAENRRDVYILDHKGREVRV